jgi:hypothetical protein
MADFSFTPAAAGIKPVPQTSLADMIGVARGAQAYQQAQQVNPLQVQQAQAELQRIQGLMPEEIKRAQAEANVAEQTQAPRISASTSQAETARISALKAQYGLDEEQHATYAKILGGFANDPRLKPENIQTNPTGPADVMHEISAEAKNAGIPEKKLFALTAPGMAKALQDPNSFNPYFQNMIQRGMTASEQRGLTLPEAVPGVAGQPPQIRDRVTGELRAAPYAAVPAQPNAPVVQPQAVTPQQMSQPPVDEISRPVPLQYPVRAPGQPYAPSPSENVDLQSGQIYRDRLVTQQTGLSAARRNLDEVIKVATDLEKSSMPTTGVAGAVTRKIAGWAGDPTYKQLSKDLANVQISNIQAMGGSLDTVAGQQLTKMASGDETYPPSVLINIARRAGSDLTNIDMQATAAQKFSAKFGDNNLKSFKQMWSKNADSKIFEAINIVDQVKDPADRKKALDMLLPKDPAERQIYLKKYQNIKKLTETGSL